MPPPICKQKKDFQSALQGESVASHISDSEIENCDNCKVVVSLSLVIGYDIMRSVVLEREWNPNLYLSKLINTLSK